MPRRHRPGTPPTPHTNTTKTWARHPNHHRIIDKILRTHHQTATKTPRTTETQVKDHQDTSTTDTKKKMLPTCCVVIIFDHPSSRYTITITVTNNLITTTPPSFRLSLVDFSFFLINHARITIISISNILFIITTKNIYFPEIHLSSCSNPWSRCRWASPCSNTPTNGHCSTQLPLRGIFFNTYMFTFIHALVRYFGAISLKEKLFVATTWTFAEVCGRHMGGDEDAFKRHKEIDIFQWQMWKWGGNHFLL